MNKDEKIIKENYGEKMWELCDKLFPEYLKEEGLIGNLMLSQFHPTYSLYDDIISEKMEQGFENYICSLINPSNFDAEKGFFKLDSYVLCGGKYYKTIDNYNVYSFEEGYLVIAFPGNIIYKGYGISHEYEDTSRYIIADKYLIDLEKKYIGSFHPDIDSFGFEFCDSNTKRSNIENIEVSTNVETGNRTIKITYDNGKNASIVIDRDNRMIEYHNHNLINIPSNYMGSGSPNLRVLDIPNAMNIGYNCFSTLDYLETLYLPHVKFIDCESFKRMKNLKRLICGPGLERIPMDIFVSLDSLIELVLPNVKVIGCRCFKRCNSLQLLDLSSASYLADSSFAFVSSLREVKLGEGVNKLIGSFVEAPELTSLVGTGVNKLMNGALKNAPKLRDLVIAKDLDSLSSDSLLNSPLLPQELLESIKVTKFSQEPEARKIGIFNQLKEYLKSGNWSVSLRHKQEEGKRGR